MNKIPYPSSHNHASVKEWDVSNGCLSTIASLHFHDYGRKSNGLVNFGDISGCLINLFLIDTVDG